MEIGLEQGKMTQHEHKKAALEMIEKVQGDNRKLAQILYRFHEMDRYTEFGFDTFQGFIGYCAIGMDMAMVLISVWYTVEYFVAIGEIWVSRLDWESMCLIHHHRFSQVQLHSIREISDRNFRDAITVFLRGGN